MERNKIPLAPFVIGFVSRQLRRRIEAGLQASSGSYLELVQRPVALTFVLISIVLVVWPIYKSLIKSHSIRDDGDRQAEQKEKS